MKVEKLAKILGIEELDDGTILLSSGSLLHSILISLKQVRSEVFPEPKKKVVKKKIKLAKQR